LVKTEKKTGRRKTTKASKISVLILITSLIVNLPSFARADDQTVQIQIPEVKVGGFIQVLFTGYENAVDEFKVNRARVKVSGDLAEDISYALLLDAAATSILYRAGIDLTYLKWAKLRLGQFKTPFSYEYLTSSSKRDTIYLSKVVDNLASKYDIGLQISGDWSYFGYALGVFNGEGRNEPDANNNKDMIGRIIFKPIKGLELGASHCEGRSGVVRLNKDRTGGYLAFIHDPLSIKGEYIYAKDDSLTRYGWYAQLAFKVIPELQALIKYATYDPDDDISDNNLDTATFGLNWFFHKNAKLQFNYLCELEDQEVDDNIYASQLQVTF
jgi:phosphate-selective porin OprO/OprP